MSRRRIDTDWSRPLLASHTICKLSL